MLYLLTQLKIQVKDSVWDRSPYSNIVFYMVHAAMYHFRNTSIPHNPKEAYEFFNKLANEINLPHIVAFCNSMKPINIIFLVCSDIDYVSRKMLERGIKTKNLNDIWNSKEYNYNMAQLHAYNWWGEYLNAPVIDVVDFISNGYTIDDMHTIIAAKIDRQPADESTGVIPDQKASKDLLQLLSSYENEVLVYNYSKK